MTFMLISRPPTSTVVLARKAAQHLLLASPAPLELFKRFVPSFSIFLFSEPLPLTPHFLLSKFNWKRGSLRSSPSLVSFFLFRNQKERWQNTGLRVKRIEAQASFDAALPLFRESSRETPFSKSSRCQEDATTLSLFSISYQLSTRYTSSTCSLSFSSCLS